LNVERLAAGVPLSGWFGLGAREVLREGQDLRAGDENSELRRRTISSGACSACSTPGPVTPRDSVCVSRSVSVRSKFLRLPPFGEVARLGQGEREAGVARGAEDRLRPVGGHLVPGFEKNACIDAVALSYRCRTPHRLAGGGVGAIPAFDLASVLVDDKKLTGGDVPSGRHTARVIEAPAAT